MRLLHATLTSAQQAASRSPYLRVHFDNRVGITATYTTRDATNRIASVEQWEEPYAGVAVVRLKNHDNALSAVDYRGYSVSIGWGIVLNDTPDANWYSNAAVMKVLRQRDISYQGELVTEFYCVSVWAEIETNYIFEGGKKLTGAVVGIFQIGELVTGAPSGATGRLASLGSDFIVVTRVTGTFAAGDTCSGGTSGATVTGIAAPADSYGILVYASGETTTEARIESLTGITVDVDEDDPDGSMADAPKLEVAIGTSIRAVIRRMLLRTKCGMRFENDGHLHVLYLDTTDAAQYEFQSTHAFFEDLRDRALVMPNTVYFVDKLPDTESAATYVGTANEPISVAAIGTFVAPIQVDPDITSDAEGNTRAAAWIAQMVAQAYQGKITAPMECGLEVYDVVQAVDARLGVTSKGRVGRIERYYRPSEGVFTVVMTLGSLYSEPGDMSVNADSIASDMFDLMSNLDMFPPAIKEAIPVWQIPKAIQGYHHDIVFTSVDQDTVTWALGTITFYDGTTQAIIAGTTGDLADTTVRHIYFDTADASPTVLKITTDYPSVMSLTTGVICLVQKGSGATVKATFIPSYGKEPLITADVIYLPGLLDLLPDGTHGKVVSTIIAAGLIQLSQGGYDTKDANLRGFNISPTEIVGQYDGVDQVVMGIDGKIVAGGGNVILDVDGVKITDQDLILYYGGGIVGYVYGIANGTALLGDVNVTIWTATDGGISVGAGSLPTAATANDLRLEADLDIFLDAGNNLDIAVANDGEIRCADRFGIGSGGLNPTPATGEIVVTANTALILSANTGVITLVNSAVTDHLDPEDVTTDIGALTPYDNVYANDLWGVTHCYDSEDDLELLKAMRPCDDDPELIATDSLPNFLKMSKTKFMEKARANLEQDNNKARDKLTKAVSRANETIETLDSKKANFQQRLSTTLVSGQRPKLQHAIEVAELRIIKAKELLAKLEHSLITIGDKDDEYLTAREQRFDDVLSKQASVSRSTFFSLSALKQIVLKLDSIEARLSNLEVKDNGS